MALDRPVLFVPAGGLRATAQDALAPDVAPGTSTLRRGAALAAHNHSGRGGTALSRTLAILTPVAIYPGIYAVVCQPARMIYVGKTSRTMAARWQEHWALLTYGRHPNTAMQ